MWYDTQIIYGKKQQNENEFDLNGCIFYKTKTGICKKKPVSGKAIKISELEYSQAWENWKDIFQ